MRKHQTNPTEGHFTKYMTRILQTVEVIKDKTKKPSAMGGDQGDMMTKYNVGS